jgi:hypothetical protein
MPGRTGTIGNARAGATRILNELEEGDRSFFQETRSADGEVASFVMAIRGPDAHELWRAFSHLVLQAGVRR